MRQLVALAALLPAVARAETVPLIPRDVLVGNPEKVGGQLSRDGKQLAYLAPDDKNVMQVWVRTLGKTDDRKITSDPKRSIGAFFWTWQDGTLVYLQDNAGDENTHLFGVNLATGNVRDYTPFQGVRAEGVHLSRKFPSKMVAGMNLRKREVFDLYAIDLDTGAVTLDTENPGDVTDWTFDDELFARGASVTLDDGGTELRVRDGLKARWRTLEKIGPEESLVMRGFTRDKKSVYLETSEGSDTTRLVLRDLATGKEKELFHSDAADLDSVWIHPDTRQLLGVGIDAGVFEWGWLDPSVKDDLDGIAKLGPGRVFVSSTDRDDKLWTVGITPANGSPRLWLWDRVAKKGSLLYEMMPKVSAYPLPATQSITIPARDGLPLHSYLTVPLGVEPKNLPMVLFVHGGPHARDKLRFDPWVQLLANRGYVVLQPNFRASTGFGKKFTHAGDKQWGLAMQDDLLDAVSWAVKQGIADPKRIAIFGGSYGGYATLAGLAFTPDVFRCGVDMFGPSNLLTLIAAAPPYWKPLLVILYTRLGNPETDRELLMKASPLNSAAKIKAPLLIGQGGNDPRVKPAESEQILAAIEKNHGRAIYAFYPDEGHGFARAENNVDFLARTERFLAEYLGGRAEPMKGDKIPGSSVELRVVGTKP
jgi:dipeptidyl aminopeptidase/acylaminoacyl peptidase